MKGLSGASIMGGLAMIFIGVWILWVALEKTKSEAMEQREFAAMALGAGTVLVFIGIVSLG
jgi:ABC-type sulfate transport system permease component